MDYVDVILGGYRAVADSLIDEQGFEDSDFKFPEEVTKEELDDLIDSYIEYLFDEADPTGSMQKNIREFKERRKEMLSAAFIKSVRKELIIMNTSYD